MKARIAPSVRRRVPGLVVAGALALASAGSGCAIVPATGEPTFTGFMDTADEIRIGREQHPKVLQAFGGAYDDAALGRYVAGIGARLAETVERKDLDYSFAVLNSDAVNAMAIPGGYVYVTRGLVALADNEAQLAGVLAHELGHVTALHHASQQGRSLISSILVAALGVAGGGLAAQGGSLIAGATLMSYSRDQEYQADELAIRYMARTGYDPREMATFLAKLRADSRLEASLRGRSPETVDQFSYLASHPAPIERVRRAQAIAAQTPVAGDRVDAENYLARIDGVLYGDDPSEGFIRDRTFLHPRLGIRFEVPPGFRLVNTARAVAAYGPDDARIVFDAPPQPPSGTLRDYLTGTWARGVKLSNVESLDINGAEAITATAQGRIGSQAFDVRLIAIRVDAGRVLRFLMLTRSDRTAALAEALRRTTYSFRRLAAAEAAGLRPHRVRRVRVAPSDTVESLAARMPFADARLERFQVLNGLEPADRLAPGRTVKLIAE